MNPWLFPGTLLFSYNATSATSLSASGGPCRHRILVHSQKSQGICAFCDVHIPMWRKGPGLTGMSASPKEAVRMLSPPEYEHLAHRRRQPHWPGGAEPAQHDEVTPFSGPSLPVLQPQTHLLFTHRLGRGLQVQARRMAALSAWPHIQEKHQHHISKGKVQRLPARRGSSTCPYKASPSCMVHGCGPPSFQSWPDEIHREMTAVHEEP